LRLALALAFNKQALIGRSSACGELIQVDCDSAELHKGHPRVGSRFVETRKVLTYVASSSLGDYEEWSQFCRSVRHAIPLVEPVNQTGEGFISPSSFWRIFLGFVRE